MGNRLSVRKETASKNKWSLFGLVASQWRCTPRNGTWPHSFFNYGKLLVVDHDRRWKFVDDTSVSEVINKNEMGKMQSLVNDMNTWCMKNDMKFNQTKCKDMIISFALEHPKLDPIFIQKHELVPVSLAKILGMYISVVLKWNTHITHIVPKACKRLYFLSLLKRSGADRSSLLTVFTTCIRPVLEYGCQASSYGITQYLSDEIERIQKRALKIIHPDLSSR